MSRLSDTLEKAATSSRTTPSSTSSRFGGGCLVLFGLPFAAVGVVMGFFALSSLRQWYEMRSWEEVPATILEARLETSSGSDSTTHRVVARYEYSFRGETFEAERVGIHGGSDNVGSFHERAAGELLDHQRRGEPFRCFVDPQRPERAVLYRELRLGLMIFYGVFVLVFGGAGFGMMALAVWGKKRLRAEEDLKASVPDEPWRWRPEWAEGKIPSGSRKEMIGVWIFAGFWNAISWPLVFLLSGEVLEEENYAALLGLLFPLIGAGLLVWAIRVTLRWRRFGRTVFEMARVPGVVGGPLQGVIRIPSRFPPPEEGFEITLGCVHRRVRGSGKNRSTREDVLWQDQRVLDRPLRSGAQAGTILPVIFAIPYDAEETRREPSDDQIVWRLRVRAELPGVDLSETFEIPVFRTGDSSPDYVPEEGRIGEFERPLEVDTVLRRRQAVVRDLGEGGRSYLFRSGATVGQKVVLSLLLAAVTFALGFMVRADLGCFPLAIVGFFEVILAASAASLWLAQYRVEAREGEVLVQGGSFGPGQPRRFAASEIASWEVATGSQSGTAVSHDLVLVPVEGKRRILVRAVGNRRESELLLADMRDRVSPRAETAAGR